MGAVPQLAFTYASLFGVVGWLCPKLSLLQNIRKYFVAQVTEDEYPYTSGDPWGDGDDQKCKFDARTTEGDTYIYIAKEVKPDLGAKQTAENCS